MALHIYKSIDDLLTALAEHVVQIAQGAIAARGEFNFVLSGGKSPELLYQMLSSVQYRNQIQWNDVNFFFGDERYVPANDPQNNARMARTVLLAPLNINPSKIFPIDTSHSPGNGATSYAEQIISHFKGAEPAFDLILLGLGDNAHTASLFPNTEVLNEQSALVQSVFVNEQNAYRITMTAPLINRAHHIAFLVYGKGKAQAVQHVLQGKHDFHQYPAQLIAPKNGSIDWYMDEAAASRLTEDAKN